MQADAGLFFFLWGRLKSRIRGSGLLAIEAGPAGSERVAVPAAAMRGTPSAWRGL